MHTCTVIYTPTQTHTHTHRPLSLVVIFFAFRHVARVLERGVTYDFAGGLGELPQKKFTFKGADTPKFNDFLPKNFWMSKCLLLMTEVPDLLQADIPRDRLQCTEHLKYMGTTCGGAVVLNDLEEFGLFEADEKSVSRQMPRSQMSGKTRDLKSGLEPTAPIASRSEDCALSTQPNPRLQNRWFTGEF